MLLEIQAIHHRANKSLVDGSIVQVLKQTADSVAALLPADRVSIIGFNTEKQAVDYVAEGGEGRSHVVKSVSYAELWEGLSGWVLTRDLPALSPKEKPDPRESETVHARRRETNCGSIVVVPVRNHDGFLGTITAINRPDQPNFDRNDVEVLLIFAISVSVLIENAKLLADLRLSRDIAEVSRLQLAEQNVMKDKLFTILAHDLRGPVGTLSTLMTFLSETPPEAGLFQEMLHEGQKSAAQTYNLLDNLLGWVRAQMEEVKVLHTRFAVVRCLVPVQLWMDPQAKLKGIKLVVDCPEAVTVAADERMFETIVRNLVSNAVKYSPERATVTIRAARREDSVVVEVSDQGRGVPPEKLSELFRHHNVHSETGTKGERGNGLGLMFCADLAQALGGRLEAESEVGLGSTFRLVLPDPVDGEL